MSQSSYKKSPLSKAVKAVAYVSWVFFGFVAAQALVSFLLVLPFVKDSALVLSLNETVLFTVIAASVYALAVLIIVGLPWLIKKQKTTLKDVGLSKLPTWMDILWAPAGLIVYLILSALLMFVAAALLPFIDFNQAQDLGISSPNVQYQYVLAFVSLVVLAPVAEEVVFRGYLFGKLRKFIPTWVAVILTSALFGLVHFQWNVAIDTFALSVVMCLLRLSTGSLWPAILLHMMKNGIAFYFLFINTGLLSTLGG